MALAMALTRVIFSLPNMSLITLALRNEEEPKAKRVASRVKVIIIILDYTQLLKERETKKQKKQKKKHTHKTFSALAH